MFTEFLQGIIDTFAALLSVIVSIFPKSPFTSFDELVVSNEMLAALAWLVPFPQIIALLEAWGAVIGVYYIWMVIARWIKLLG